MAKTAPVKELKTKDSVDPFDIPPCGSLTKGQLEYWVLFGIAVCGKGASQTARKLDAFLRELAFLYLDRTPFELVKVASNNGTLDKMLRQFKFGQYKRILRAFELVVALDVTALQQAPVNESLSILEAIPGLGPKTARMILLYAKPKAEVVPLDTHVLKYLKAKGFDVPKNTPPAGSKYRELETAFINIAKLSGYSVREFDTKVWLSYAKKELAKPLSKLV